jgi:signal transduction histidine kinase
MLTFHATLLSWLFAADNGARSALQWWYQRHIHRTHEGAELIRDGILQELFAIRRALELAHTQQQPVSQESLQQLEALHYELEKVSNQLAPAYSGDSLSLAIQYLLNQLQRHYPAIAITAQIAGTPIGLSLSSRVALTALDELLALVIQKRDQAISVTVALEERHKVMQLTVRLAELRPGQCGAIAQLPDLAHLRQSFQFLTDGSSQQHVHDTWIEWHFCWPQSCFQASS